MFWFGRMIFFGVSPRVSRTPPARKCLSIENLLRALLARKHGIVPGRTVLDRGLGHALVLLPICPGDFFFPILADFGCCLLAGMGKGAGSQDVGPERGGSCTGPKPQAEPSGGRDRGSALGRWQRAVPMAQIKGRIRILRHSFLVVRICCC